MQFLNYELVKISWSYRFDAIPAVGGHTDGRSDWRTSRVSDNYDSTLQNKLYCAVWKNKEPNRWNRSPGSPM